MVRKRIFSIVVFIIVISGILFLTSFTSAFVLNGTVFDINGNRLANATINITVRSTTNWGIVGYNFTTSNESGWFNITVTNNALWMYEPKTTHINTTIPTKNYSDYVGQSLPAFPSFMYDQLGSLNSYLRPAGSFNLTAINSTGQRTAFNYQIKDVLLGYPVADSFNFESGGVFEANVVVPADRNYSVMIFPNQSLPVSFSWNNFSSSATYNITTPASGNNISHYNGTTKTVNKQFNITMSLPRINGTANFTGAINVTGLDNFTIVAYLMEAGNMVHATYGSMLYNMSAFTGGTDVFFANNATFNMSLPASAETTTYLLFATGRNGTNYLGAFANLTIQYGASPVNIDFMMRGLLGNLSYIGLDNAGDFSNKKLVASAKQGFQLVNKTNSSLSQAFSHIEITVNYSNWGNVPEFTWMEEIPQTGNGNFSIPLLNVTGIKEMNIFTGGGDYAPRRVELTVAQILSRRHVQGGSNLNLSMYNITMNSFSAGDIDGQMVASNISMALYISNSSCDVPSPASNCLIGGSGQNMSNFNPMSAIMGGGKLSFRMGTGNISVHYVNVDMLASGPPEALFDDSATDRTSGSAFDQAVRFGSGGPTIYDFILVSIPYAETVGSGLNDSNDVNMTIPLLYDDNWNAIWNTSANGTSAGALANNFTHYVAKQSEWTYLLGQNNCTTNVNEFNVSRPCYIDKTGNVIWIRLPHFSGTGPSIVGSVVAAATTTTTTSPVGGGGGGNVTEPTTAWTLTYSITEKQISKGYSQALAVKNRVKVPVEGKDHFVGVVGIDDKGATINVSSTPQQALLLIGGSKKFDVTNDSYYDLKVTLNSINNSKANITIIAIKEKMTEEASKTDNKLNDDVNPSLNNTENKDDETSETSAKSSKTLLIILGILVLIIVVAVIAKLVKEKKYYKRGY